MIIYHSEGRCKRRIVEHTHSHTWLATTYAKFGRKNTIFIECDSLGTQLRWNEREQKKKSVKKSSFKWTTFLPKKQINKFMPLFAIKWENSLNNKVTNGNILKYPAVPLPKKCLYKYFTSMEC